jgi:rhodanese-related sulfurtransferase
MKNLDNKEWKSGFENTDNAKILDVRTPGEFAEGYIPQAKLINIQDPAGFTEEVEKLDKDQAYYIYCRSGKRSQMACQVMENMGFKDVNNLATGIMEWDGEIEK